jgi:AraC-like DNA-binding protein
VDAANSLTLNIPETLKAQNAGLFVSRGNAKHPTRVIQSHELIFVKQGELTLWEEAHTFHLQAGDVLHLWPGRQHGSSEVMPAGLKFYWIHFELSESAAANRPNNGESSLASIAAVQIPQTNHLPNPEKIERLFRLFLDEQEAGSLQPNAANLLAVLMLVEASRPAEKQSLDFNHDPINAVATWAHTYITLNYDRPISAGSVAEAIGYNLDYVGRVYQAVYHCTLTDAIHRQRIHVACQYLLDTSITIEQIADKCGFNDPDYFRRVFRRYTQTSPGAYRKAYARIRINTH